MIKLNIKRIIFIIFCIVIVILAIIIPIVLYNHNNNKNSSISFKQSQNYTEEDLKMKIIINNNEFQCTLENNDTSKALLENLPITINMNELNGNEKYYYFEERFPTKQQRINKIYEGDIMLYGNSCLVLFYDTFNSGYSYTKIGKITNPENLKKVVGKGNVTVTISK